MKTLHSFFTSAIATMMVIGISTKSHAATLVTDNFESYTTSIGGVWTTSMGADLYIHQTLNQPTDSTTFNYASDGTKAAWLEQSGGAITSSIYDLSGASGGDTISISYSYSMHNGSTTRRGDLEYSNNGGTNWYQLVLMQTGGTRVNNAILTGTVTITQGSSTINRTGDFIGGNGANPAYAGEAFTNQSMFRFRNRGSAGGTGYKIFVDDVSITTSFAVVPELSTNLLGLLGACGLLLWRRRH